MNVLVIGSGGREHAIAWKVAQSPKLTKLYIAPGNAGTAAHGENVVIKTDDHLAVAHFCKEKKIDLVIVGPEVPLAAGLADDLFMSGVRVFGPTKAAAQIEASKVFSKNFMRRHGIPTARFEIFTDFKKAVAALDRMDYPIVIKASGLAAGKGVILPDDRKQALETLDEIMVKNEFGAAGAEVVIEERLTGPEVTLLAFCDGKTVKPMVPSQDHKRIFDGDRGPNTGGMGAYAPVPVCPPEMVTKLVRIALQPVVDGLQEEGNPFVGVLYGGFMLTPDGPRVIEFNCRFGDPEAQVVLPLLESDLLTIAEACVDGHLDQMDICWKDAAAACVVLASGGYPGKYQIGYPVSGLETDISNAFVFHAGTKLSNGKVITAGGRVLGVTAWAGNLSDAVKLAYKVVGCIRFEEIQYRSDIAARALKTDAGTDWANG